MKVTKNLYLFIFSTLILSGFGFGVFAQEDKEPVFVGDLDGNGKAERIIQTKFQKPTKFPSIKDITKKETRNGYYIRYVLYRNDQTKGLTIFEYLIGDDESMLWKYEIEKTADLNNDGLKDLIFYASDDGGSETVFLIQKPDYFKAVYSGIIGLDADYLLDFDISNNIVHKSLYSKPPQIIATWNPQKEIFEGLKIKWITKNSYAYKTPNENSEKIFRFYENAIVFTSKDPGKTQYMWQEVSNSSGEGWVKTQLLSNVSPTKRFPTE